jgi:hypothetical protein
MTMRTRRSTSTPETHGRTGQYMYIYVTMKQRSSPIVLRANHFQFGPGEAHSFGPVKSCMQLWCRAGRGVVSTPDTELELVAGRVLLLPWGHRIRYEANRRKPFLVSGVHVWL